MCRKSQILIKYLFKFIILIGLINLCGCPKEEEKPKIEYNPVLSLSQFYNDLSSYHILMIAPGSKVDEEKIQAIENISKLNIKIPSGLFSEEIAYHSSNDKNRFEELKTALESEDPQLILWTLRGGYGSARLIEQLTKLPKPKKEKIIIGYSDMTALNLFLSQKWGWKPIHGAMLADLLKENKDPENFLRLSNILAKKYNASLDERARKNSNLYTEINHLVPMNEKAKQMVTIQGLLTGGNLTIVQNSIGTPWQIQTKNKILFLEDDGEKGYKIDRSLYQLREAGILNGVKAIILGDFTEGDEYSALALQRFADEINLPVFKTDEFGHGIKNYPLIYNAKSTLEKSKFSDEYQLRMQY